jgi:hypothetical protein
MESWNGGILSPTGTRRAGRSMPGAKLGSFRTIPAATRPQRAKLGSFCAFTLRRLRPTGRNWVRFARFTPRPGRAQHGNWLCPHTPVPLSLASFCTISSVSRLAWGRIGFVSHERLCVLFPPDIFQSAIRNHQSAIPGHPAQKLGSFCTFHSPAGTRPTWQLALPKYPSPPKFGFVLHDFLWGRVKFEV